MDELKASLSNFSNISNIVWAFRGFTYSYEMPEKEQPSAAHIISFNLL